MGLFHLGTPDQVEHVEFQSEGLCLTDVLQRLEHHIFCLAGKPQDQVRNDTDASRLQAADRIVVIRYTIAEIHGCGSLRMDRLNNQFHP